MSTSDTDLQSEWLWLTVFNQEQQWALWPEHLPLPEGWTVHGEPLEQEQALARIQSLWTDMRPRSLQ